MVQRDRSKKRGDRLSALRPQNLPKNVLEHLENRLLLSTSPNDNLRDVRNGPMSNAGGQLLNLYLNYRGAQHQGVLHAFTRSDSSDTGAFGDMEVRGDKVGIEIHVSGDLNTATAAFEAQGMVVTSTDTKDNVVAGDYPITLLHELSIRPDVINVRALSRPVLHSVGLASDQADSTLKASLARNTYNLSGQGVKVGVISDSINAVGGGVNDSIATGDLPASGVTQLVGGNGNGDTDEGRAMLEEIHDLAPNAQLFFASADGGQQAFATSVQDLVNSGCTVIVDDVGFVDEPFFQPGVIDAAINNAVASGVAFITAAGNNGANGFEQAANWVPDNTNPGNFLVNFNPSGTADTMMTITTSTAGQLNLQWDDPYNGVTATERSDLNIALFNSTGTVVRFVSNDNNFQTGVPIETIANVPAGTYKVQISATNTTAGNLPTYYGFNGDFTLTSTQYTGLRTSIIGHSAFSNAISIGAVPFYNAPPYSSTTPIATESFSGQGPVIEARDANGNLLASPVTLNKPDLSGTDENNTSFFGNVISQTGNNLPSFAGTSAAAGNVAGVIALIRQEFPTDTPAQILAALKATATPLNGKSAGQFDPAGGYGLIDAVATIQNLGGTTAGPIATIEPVIPNPTTSPVNTIAIDFNEVVSGVTASDFTLSLDGGSNLLGNAAVKINTNDGEHYEITNLYTLTGASGVYTLTLNAAGSGILGVLNQALTTNASVTWTKSAVFTVPDQPTKMGAETISQASIRLTWHDNATNEDTYTLEYSTNPALKVNLKKIVLPPDSTDYTVGRLAVGQRYYFRVFATNGAGDSYFSGTASDATLSRGELIVDNSDAKHVSFNGEVTTSSIGTGYIGSDYFQDGNTAKGTMSVTYTPSLLRSGNYYIYANWPHFKTNATNVPFDVFSQRKVLEQTVVENEKTKGGSGWVLLGKFYLKKNAGASVRIRNKGTKGNVIFDALRFLPEVAIPGGTTQS